MIFFTAVTGVISTLFYIIPGYILRKIGKVSEKGLASLSAVLIYICTPFLMVSAYINISNTYETTVNMLLFFCVTFFVQLLFVVTAALILRKKYSQSKYRMLTIGAVAGNVGFFGMPLIKTIFPSHPYIAAYSAVFMFSMNLIIFTVGIFCITGQKKYISLKSAVFNPTVLGFVFSVIFYVFGIGQILPETFKNVIVTIGNMSAPLCMTILGIRLGSVKFKEIWKSPIVYVTAVAKLIVFPLFAFALVRFLPLDSVFKASVIILCSTPCATLILGLSEMYDNSQSKISADCILTSTLLCAVTIPLMALLSSI